VSRVAPEAKRPPAARRGLAPVGAVRSGAGLLTGSRAVWLPAGVVGTIFLGLLVWQLALPRPYYTGTNSVGMRSVVATVNAGQKLCVPDLHLPASTGRVQLALFGQPPRFAAELTVSAAGRSVTSRMAGVPGPTLLAFPQATIPTRPASPASVPATICVAPLGSSISVGGTAGLQSNQVPASLDGVPVANRVAVWFLPPAGSERSLLASAGAIFARAALFRPGAVGAWTYPVLLFGLLPLLWVASLVLLARAATGRATRMFGRALRPGIAIALIAFVNAAAWALITPAFNAPDEPDHFAYAQYLATTGHAPAHSDNARPPYSTDEGMAVNAVDLPSEVGLTETRPPWLAVEQRQWERERASVRHPADNGGGITAAASSHQPAYYLLVAPAYEAVRSQSPFSQLTAMRLGSALLGALVAFCAYGIVSELLPGRRVAALAAGLLVAFQPMFGFISGAVNNDNGVNAAAALSLYLLIRALRRGLTWRLALALGATLAITPFMKETGYEIYPPVAIGLLGILWRRRRLPDLRALALPAAALAAAFALVRGGWSLLQGVFYPTIAGHSSALGGTSASGAIRAAEQMPTRFLVYLWEIFLPRLPFMAEHLPPGWPFRAIYVVSGWGAFGWDVLTFPSWVYEVIVIAMGLVGLLALSAAVRFWPAVRARGFEAAVIVLFPISTSVAVEATFFNGGAPLPIREQGRYIFPAISALAAIAVAGTFGLGRRWHVPLATTLVVAVIGMSYASQWLTLGSFFT
jgi:Predicted membrane protein (DUF2142)